MRIVFSGVKTLKIDFQSVRYGLIFFTLTLGEKSFETNFSDVFDPILELKKWLEAICIGVQQCSFCFDPEGDEIKFDFQSEPSNQTFFTVSYAYGDDKIFLSDYVDRRQLVEAFYCELLEFRQSPDFIQSEWEIEYLWERLTAILKVDYETILKEFLELDRENIKTMFFKADPQYLISCPSAPEEEAFGYAVDSELGNKIPPEYEIVKTPIEWEIPEDYDSWMIERKKDFVKNCINGVTGGQRGTKIVDFKSKIIEDFLARNFDKKNSFQDG